MSDATKRKAKKPATRHIGERQVPVIRNAHSELVVEPRHPQFDAHPEPLPTEIVEAPELVFPPGSFSKPKRSVWLGPWNFFRRLL